MVEQPLQTYDDLCGIVADPAAKAVFVVRDISPAQMVLIDLAAKTLGAAPLKHGESRSLNDAFETLKKWWRDLPAVAKVLSLYEETQRPRLTELKGLMDDLTGSVDRFDFMLEKLPAAYSTGPVGDALTEEGAKAIGAAFAEDVNRLDTGVRNAQGKVAQAVCQIYGAGGDLIECEKAVGEWYAGLNPSQRDPYKCDHEDGKQLLVRLSDTNTPFSKKLFKLLATDYGFGDVSQWTSLHVEDYAAKIKQAKAEVDKSKPVIYKPVIAEGVHELREDQKMVVRPPDGAAGLIFTLDGSDPRTSATRQKGQWQPRSIRASQRQPNVKVKMRAVDENGNASDAVSVELVSRERKYEIQVEPKLFGKEATFKCPEDSEGLVAVIKSMIGYGVKHKLLSMEKADRIKAVLQDVKTNK